MRNKRLLRTLSAFCLTMVVAFGFTIPAFAQGSEQAPAAPAEDSTNDSNVTVEETEPAPALTPVGEGGFHLFMRIYTPDMEALKTWTVPTITAID